MIPNPNEVSAFAVYSGLVGQSKSRKRRNRLKKSLETQKENVNGKSFEIKAKTIPIKSGKINKSNKSVIAKNKIRKSKPVKKDSICELDSSSAPEPVDQTELKYAKSTRRNNLSECSQTKLTKSNECSLAQDISINEGNGKPVKGKRKSKENSFKETFTVLEVANDDEQKNTGKNGKASSLTPNIKSAKGKIENVKTGSKKVRPDRVERKRLLKEEVKKQLKGKPSTSSVVKGKTVFDSLITPMKADDFISEYWEKKPLFIDRGGNNPAFSQYLSTADMDAMLRYNMLMFGRNVDITSYTDGVRETHNPEGRAHPHIVWDYFSNGCSIRILNPQTYLNKIHTLLAALQEYFGCFVGSNIYLTPANTQGFAPHYDDIEAFVLQVEGAKRWKVYEPKSKVDELPRVSSRNFNQSEIGSPIMDLVLRPGDLLYFPRGFIHQAEALPDQHSLHLTISTYQKTTWLDLIEQALPVALARASEENVDYRRGLPIGYLRGAGLAYPSASLRFEMISKLKKLIFHLEKHLDIDDAVDKLGVSFIHQSLPPVLSLEESECSVHNGGLKLNGGKVINRVDLTLETKVRWIRANAFRLVEDSEDLGQVKLYHSVDNSKEYEGDEVQFVVLDKEFLPALFHLVKSYPAYVPVLDLPCSSDDEKLVLTGDLWDRGLLVCDCPLKPSQDTNSS